MFGVVLGRAGRRVVPVVPVSNPQPPPVATMGGKVSRGRYWIGVGILMSSFTRNQVVAFVLSFVATIMTFSIGFAGQLFPSTDSWKWATALCKYASFQNALDSFPRGVIDTRPVVYFLSLTVFTLYLAVRIVESRRWR